MKNYEDMSDSQIAQKVFFFVSGNLCPNGGLAHISSDGFFFFDEKNIKRKFDPCNNPYDAWPIIVENHIAVVPYQYTIPQAWPTAFGAASKFTTEDGNPLRAAMIVFLKMNEGKL
ncbi:hypothetical protein KGB41_gp68 [Salmonella virus KFS-SE2]|uniref:NinX n=1 Tax=Salmonella virus KFS-SE2 TaxID=2583286 RepID=A0A4Y5TLR3_9CAUD|nr:hypothetical protein KGB41_gp68 [Salmonella virus KFS-SE2]QDB70225.1 hypothetical protein [Salmonella virus KFS-SE2]